MVGMQPITDWISRIITMRDIAAYVWWHVAYFAISDQVVCYVGTVVSWVKSQYTTRDDKTRKQAII
jgi:hypothetical protein